jgi:glycolate oxidase FAD binding subunit
MAAMAELRGVMDPATIANPGKMLFVDRATDAGPARVTLAAPAGAGGVHRPRDAAELAEVVAWARRVHVRGAGTKPALAAAPDPDAAVIETLALTGVREYEPGEFTFTALAGTPVAEVERMLAEHGQYLPFDPPFARAGATLGGAVASGLGGPGRVRFGGVRDFVIGGRFVDGRGRLLRVGAAVVKNAAGFDFPKLLVGSLGRLGVIAELTFKVFPSPEAWASLETRHASLAAAIEAAGRLLTASVELAALEIEPLPQGALLRARLAGLAAQLPPRLGRLAGLALPAGLAGDSRTLAGAGEAAVWEASRDCLWAQDAALLVRVPATLGRVADIERAVAAFMPLRRYGCGGAAAWLAAPRAENTLGALRDALTALGLRGLVVRGPAGLPLLGVDPDAPFRRRVLSVLDPEGRFTPYTGHAHSGG